MGMIQAPNQTPADRLDQMVQQYEKDLLRICSIYLRDRTAAEDAVQETFLKAFRNMDSFLRQGDSSFVFRCPGSRVPSVPVRSPNAY